MSRRKIVISTKPTMVKRSFVAKIAIGGVALDGREVRRKLARAQRRSRRLTAVRRGLYQAKYLLTPPRLLAMV